MSVLVGWTVKQKVRVAYSFAYCGLTVDRQVDLNYLTELYMTACIARYTSLVHIYMFMIEELVYVYWLAKFSKIGARCLCL